MFESTGIAGLLLLASWDRMATGIAAAAHVRVVAGAAAAT